MRRSCAAVALVVLTFASAASAHQGNPHFRSIVQSVSPSTPGLKLEVLNFDDRLELTNRSNKTVIVRGYDREPYLRFLPDGTVQVNAKSPAKALNNDRYGGAQIPASANSSAPPQWQTIDKTGRFDWHDHRIHWMARGTPPIVKDQNKRTKVFNWNVPLTVGNQTGSIRGQLVWVPVGGGSAPTGAIVALVAIVALGAVAVIVVRRRRGEDEPVEKGSEAEAW